MTGRQDSEYGRDLRVQWPGEGGWSGENCLAYLPDGYGSGRVVMVAGGGCTVRGLHSPDATLIDPGDMYGRRPQIFSTVDEAIAAVIGEPWVSVLTVEEIVTLLDAGMPVGVGVECRVLIRQHPDGAWQVSAWVVWQGGFGVLHTWPADVTGLGQAGVWAVEHQALDDSGYPIRDHDALLVHVGNL